MQGRLISGSSVISLETLSAEMVHVNETEASAEAATDDQLESPSENDTMPPHLIDDDVPLLDSVRVETAVYKRRWYMLFAFTAMSFMQGAMPNVWTVIAESVEPAFGWSDPEVSLMMNWIYITYLLAMFPTAWIVDFKGESVIIVSVDSPSNTYFSHFRNPSGCFMQRLFDTRRHCPSLHYSPSSCCHMVRPHSYNIL
jgi:hypothetical protein